MSASPSTSLRAPEDGRGWEVIAPVYLRLERPADAVRAYRNAVRLLGSTATRQNGLGQALFMESGGIVTQEAREAFAAATAADLAAPEPKFFLGLAAEQDGRPAEAAAIIEELGADGLRLQFDFYHVQIVTGDLARSFERHLPLIGHVQIAGVPERHEPDVGEINYPYLFDLMDRLRYAGWVGCEYFPAGGTEEGLGWAYRYGIAPRSTTLATGGERV